MQLLFSIIHVTVGLFLILVVLLQTGKSGGMGAGFGGGSSTGVFGARGANPFLSKLTAASAIVFFLTSMTLSVMSSKTGSVVSDHATPAAPPAPDAAVEGTAGADANKPSEATPPPAADSPTSPVEQPKTAPEQK